MTNDGEAQVVVRRGGRGEGETGRQKRETLVMREMSALRSWATNPAATATSMATALMTTTRRPSPVCSRGVVAMARTGPSEGANAVPALMQYLPAYGLGKPAT